MGWLTRLLNWNTQRKMNKLVDQHESEVWKLCLEHGREHTTTSEQYEKYVIILAQKIDLGGMSLAQAIRESLDESAELVQTEDDEDTREDPIFPS